MLLLLLVSLLLFLLLWWRTLPRLRRLLLLLLLQYPRVGVLTWRRPRPQPQRLAGLPMETGLTS